MTDSTGGTGATAQGGSLHASDGITSDIGAGVGATATRADVCRLLAACYYQPDHAFAEERMFASMATACAGLGPEFRALAESLGSAFACEPLDDLLVEYTRLFLGPVDARAAPYASAWLPAQTSSPISPVLALYERAGFELVDDFADLPDHIAVELEFLYVLLFRRAEAISNGDIDALAKHEDLERHFVKQHLDAWIHRFVHAVHEEAQTQFYRTLAKLTERFVATELQLLAAQEPRKSTLRL